MASTKLTRKEEVARASLECNICGERWPHHLSRCIYLANDQRRKELERALAALKLVMESVAIPAMAGNPEGIAVTLNPLWEERLKCEHAVVDARKVLEDK